MRRKALTRLASGVGMLMVVMMAIIACGGGGAAEWATPDSPISSEPGWLAYQ